MATDYNVTKAAVEARLSADILRAICDDDNDGTADDDPINQFIRDAVSYVEGFLRRVYPLDTIRAMGDPPNEITRLVLDRIEARANQRHPEVARIDGIKMVESNRRELMDLAEGKTRLDIVGSPEPAANEGGYVGPVNQEDGTTPQRFFGHDGQTGIY